MKGGMKMANVRENIENYESAKTAVKEHCMCVKFVEEADRFIVFFPSGYRVDAAQMRFMYQGVTKIKALELLLNTMEKYWKLG